MLIAFCAMTAVVLSGCSDDDATAGIDPSMPAPHLYYDSDLSGSKSIAVYWDAEQANSAGAVTYTLQLLTDKNGTADVYDTSVTQTISKLDSKGDVNVMASFENLARGSIYYVRMRANYPRSVYSEWVLAAVSESDATPARIMVGNGIVDDDAEALETIEAKFINSTESSVTVAWTTCENYEANATDQGIPYRLELYKDKAMKNLVVAWNTSANMTDATSTANLVFKLGTRMSFPGLEANTTYYFRAINANNTEVVSDLIECKTTESNYKALPATAAAGDVILYQDFHELVYGGNYPDYAAGVSTTTKGTTDEFWAISGDDPTKDTDKGLVLCSGDREIGLFNTLANSVKKATTLKDWGRVLEVAGNASTEKGTLCARQGLLKMGASKYCATVATPVLSCLTAPATVEVSFRAASIEGYEANETVFVYLLDDTSIDSSFWVSAKTKTTVGSVETGAANDWQTYTITVDGVTSTSRIAIGGTPGAGAAQHRFYLDDIQLKVVSYGQLTAPDAPAKPTLTASDKTITAKWDAVSRASSYTLEYKKSADSDWTAVSGIEDTTYTIEGLSFETAYDVRVSATASGLTSDPSEVAQITTLAEIKKLDTPSNITAIGGLGWVWLQFAPVTNATDYEVYNGDTKVDAKVESAEGAATVNLCAYNLELNKSYTLKVKAVSTSAEASDLSEAATATTGNIAQQKTNVGPTHISVKWDDVSGGTSTTTKGYYVELSKDKSMSNPVYSLLCADGQGTTDKPTGAFGASSWYGKAASKNLAPPTAVTFGQLEASTTYYFRVRCAAGETFTGSKGNVTLNSPNGKSEFSPVVAFTTEAKHTATAKEVLYEGFDGLGMQSDFLNVAAGTTPSTTSTSSVANPHTGAWCIYPFATSHLMSTWGYAEAGNYIDGTDTHLQAASGKLYVGNAKSTLEGWYFGDQVSPHHGFVKVGNSSYSNYFIATPALTSSLLSASGTACTLSFKAVNLMVDSGSVKIEAYRAATKTFETVATIAVEMAGGSSATSTDYVADPATTYKTYSTDITLAPGDNVAIVTTNKNRIALDDILIVTK